MKQAVKKLETRTRRGKTEALCKKCGTWQALDDDHWYRHAGQELPYLGHCKGCERRRSSAWHREHRATRAAARNVARKRTAKKTTAKSTSKKTAAKKTAARKTTARKTTRKTTNGRA